MRVRVATVGGAPALAGIASEILLPEGATVSVALDFLGVADPSSVVALLDGGPAGPDSPLREGALLELMPIVDGG